MVKICSVDKFMADYNIAFPIYSKLSIAHLILYFTLPTSLNLSLDPMYTNPRVRVEKYNATWLTLNCNIFPKQINKRPNRA